MYKYLKTNSSELTYHSEWKDLEQAITAYEFKNNRNFGDKIISLPNLFYRINQLVPNLNHYPEKFLRVIFESPMIIYSGDVPLEKIKTQACIVLNSRDKYISLVNMQNFLKGLNEVEDLYVISSIGLVHTSIKNEYKITIDYIQYRQGCSATGLDYDRIMRIKTITDFLDEN